MSTDLKNSTILVTGAFGFLGKHLMDALRGKFATVTGVPRGVNLMDPYHLIELFHKTSPQYVFHLAGFNGGIEFNLEKPADIFMRNTVIWN